MLLKLFIFAYLIVVLYCLGSALYYLVREGRDSKHMASALTWRIVLSLGLFVFLIVCYFFGWITPHGIMPN